MQRALWCVLLALILSGSVAAETGTPTAVLKEDSPAAESPGTEVVVPLHVTPFGRPGSFVGYGSGGGNRAVAVHSVPDGILKACGAGGDTEAFLLLSREGGEEVFLITEEFDEVQSLGDSSRSLHVGWVVRTTEDAPAEVLANGFVPLGSEFHVPLPSDGSKLLGTNIRWTLSIRVSQLGGSHSAVNVRVLPSHALVGILSLGGGEEAEAMLVPDFDLPSRYNMASLESRTRGPNPNPSINAAATISGNYTLSTPRHSVTLLTVSADSTEATFSIQPRNSPATKMAERLKHGSKLPEFAAFDVHRRSLYSHLELSKLARKKGGLILFFGEVVVEPYSGKGSGWLGQHPDDLWNSINAMSGGSPPAMALFVTRLSTYQLFEQYGGDAPSYHLFSDYFSPGLLDVRTIPNEAFSGGRSGSFPGGSYNPSWDKDRIRTAFGIPPGATAVIAYDGKGILRLAKLGDEEPITALATDAMESIGKLKKP